MVRALKQHEGQSSNRKALVLHYRCYNEKLGDTQDVLLWETSFSTPARKSSADFPKSSYNYMQTQS